jgi:CheY-like chemotaxis protein
MPPQEVLVCAKPSTARLIAGVLRSRGYAVETVGDGARAVEGAERRNPDVVLIWADLRGPEITGVIRRVREASAARVAVIASREAVHRASEFRASGADAVLVDGQHVDRLARVVDRLLGGGLIEDILDLPAGETYQPEANIPNGNGQNADHVSPAGSEAGEAGSEEAAEPAEPGIPFELCNVATIVQEGAAEAARGFPAVVVRVSAPSKLPAVGHPGALRGAVRALVEEACRDSDAGFDVTVKVQRVDAGIFVLVADRGPAPGGGPPEETGGPPSGTKLARALVALHGGIVSVEPIPAGGRRASFTIPEQPPLLTGIELQGGFRALELLDLAEAAWRGEEPAATEPEAEEEAPGEAIDLAAAAADAAAVAAPERPQEPENRKDPIRSLAELFGFDEEEPAVGEVPESQAEPEPDEEPVDAEAPWELEPERLFEDEIAEVEAGLEVLETFEPEPDEPEPFEVETLALEPFEVESVEPEPADAEPVEAEVEVDEPEVEPVEPGETEPEPDETEEVEPESVEAEDTDEEEPEPELIHPAEPVEPEPELPAAVITLPPHEEEPAAEVEPPSEPEPVEVPEPVPAAEATAPEPSPTNAPPKPFVPNPLHPATAILRALAEEYDTDSNPFRLR